MPHRVRVDGAALGQIAGDASYYYTIYRDLLAAQRAYLRGDPAPLLRMAAEDLPFTGGGPVTSYSEGAYAAVACHDYPTIWDPAAPLAERREQLRGRTSAADPGCVRAHSQRHLAALALHRPGRQRLHPLAGAGPTRPAGAARRDLPGHARAGARRRSRRDHPAGRLVARGLAVPELDARDRARTSAT